MFIPKVVNIAMQNLREDLFKDPSCIKVVVSAILSPDKNLISQVNHARTQINQGNWDSLIQNTSPQLFITIIMEFIRGLKQPIIKDLSFLTTTEDWDEIHSLMKVKLKRFEIGFVTIISEIITMLRNYISSEDKVLEVEETFAMLILNKDMAKVKPFIKMLSQIAYDKDSIYKSELKR
eukprot:CAMPEP_0170564174 /NCGR_PEP_ID=MMETSP0211-20121228/71460_1 /TAXON_ID=311385 /ORGANISM="Pseudokeronopsis sp., Strain OXSARD2" /LENGTH=177 /DNA_ID=CAMNT_0010883331 /DNA_START=751 /DNA_END=1284 /DNA_ORIENTATION=+